MTVLMYYKIKPNREKLLKSIKYKKDNYTAYDIVKMSKVYGLDSSGIKISFERLNKFPAIAHVITENNYFHFIVIYKIDKKRRVLTVMDPATGIKEIGFDQFKKITTNIFITFNKTTVSKNDNRMKKELLKIVNSNKKIIIKTLTLSVLFIILSLLFNYYLKLILTYHKNLSIIKLIFISFIIICSFKNFLNYLKNKLVLKLNIKIDKDITKRVLNHLFHLPNRYFDRKTSGEVITIISDIESFKNCIINMFILSFLDLFLLFIITIYIYFLNFYIGLYLTIFLSLLFLITNKYKYIFNNTFTPFKVRSINYQSRLIETLNGIDSVKNLNLEEKIEKKLDSNYLSMKEEERTYHKKYYNYDFLISFFTDLLYITFIMFLLYIISTPNIYDIVLYSSLFYMIISFSKNLFNSISSYKVEEYKVNRVLDLLEEPVEKTTRNSFKVINSIVYKNMSYKNVLKGINLEIKKGDKIFLTGASGVGKTTLFKLLKKDISPTSGSILIDNINLNEYPLSFIKDKIIYVSQNESLFKGSIIDNLKLVKDDISKIKEVSKITLLDQILESKKIDYNFLLSEFGSNLSGGEKKKIILTRALLKEFDILILDEVFNEISIEEEFTILNNILKKYPDKTVIVISHRNNNTCLFNKKYLVKGDGINEIK